MSADLDALGAHIVSSQPGVVRGHAMRLGELTIDANATGLVSLVTFLRDDPRCKFTTLVDLCGVDFPERAERFEVVYHLLSMPLNQRLRIRVATNEQTPVPSIAGIFPCADWFEREAFDMYGVLFAGHPDLRRLLTDYGFQGHPLRKDFPLTGHVEVRYDSEQQRVAYEPVTLTQAYRNFDYLSPWEGMTRELPGDEKAEKAP